LFTGIHCCLYLWGGDTTIDKKNLVSWVLVCDHEPKSKGGLSVEDAGKWNSALIGRYVWNIACKEDTVWARWIHHVYLKEYLVGL